MAEHRTRTRTRPSVLFEGVITGDEDGSNGLFYYVKIEKPKDCPPSLAEKLEVTFSYNFWLLPDEYPEVGQKVRLGNLREFSKGWRARWAEPITFPESELEKR